MTDMVEQLRIQQIDVAILTVPQEVAQDATNRLTEAGVRGIMNFTPIRLSVPENVRVQNVDLTNELQTLIYFLDNDIGWAKSAVDDKKTQKEGWGRLILLFFISK